MKAYYDFKRDLLSEDSEILFSVDFPENNSIPPVFSKGKKLAINKVEVLYFIDNPTTKEVIAIVKHIGPIVLWKDSSYDTIGDWTNADVENRIIELYS